MRVLKSTNRLRGDFLAMLLLAVALYQQPLGFNAGLEWRISQNESEVPAVQRPRVPIRGRLEEEAES